MVTANELLTGVSVSDKTLVVSNDLRTINIPSSVCCLGVEHDDDVLELSFKMPRYLGNTDLSDFAIRINYMNAQGEGDIYTVNNPTVGAQYVTFSWLVGPTATRYKGDTKFNVCLRTLTSDGTVDREYNTTIATLPVLEGLEVDESYLESYSDLLEQWRSELFGIGDTEEAKIKAASETEQEAIANKAAEVLATIPEDYQTTFEMIDNADRTKSDAIICSAQGDVISISDSSDDYLRGLKIFGNTTQVSTTGKNLFTVDETIINDLITYDAGSQKISVDVGTLGVVQYLHYFDTPVSAGTPVTITVWFDSGRLESNSSVTIGGYHKADSGSTWQGHVTIPNGTNLAGQKLTATVTTTDTVNSVVFFMNAGSTITTKLTFKVQFEIADTSTDYEVYSGAFASPSPKWSQELSSIENPNLCITGKNFFDMSAIIESDSITRQSDGSLTITQYYNNTQKYLKDLAPGLIVGKKYILLLDTDGSRFIYMSKYNGVWDHGYTFTMTDDMLNSTVVIYGIQEQTADTPTTIRSIQIVLAGESHSYEAYRGMQKTTLEHVLSGIPVTSGGNYTDANGQQWVCDEIDFERGVHIQRLYTLALDGTENITREMRYENSYRFIIRPTSPVAALSLSSGYCTHFLIDVDPIGYNNKDEVIYVWTTGICYCRYDAITSADDMTTWLSEQYAAGTPVTVIYPLATPIETPLTAEEIEAFRFAHTNFPNTTVLNDAGATMELKYNADTKTWLENLPKASDEQVQAAVDAWLTARYSNAEGVSF